MKKRTLTVLTAAFAASVLLFTGCGSSESTDDAGTSSDNSASVSDAETGNDDAATTAGGYQFESNGVSISVDVDVDPIVEALGEAKSVYEQPSCAGQGTSYAYSYSGFEIATYPDGDSNLIAYILIKDDTVSTPEGIDLSMTKDDVIAAYGDNYTAEGFDSDDAVASDAGNGKLTYEKDGMTLNFFFDGENISSIEYDSGVLN
jgi:hypothetical protein